MKNFAWHTSLTIWGGLVAAFGYLSQPEVLAVLPKKPAAIVTAIGAVAGIIGARNAISKNGNGQ